MTEYEQAVEEAGLPADAVAIVVDDWGLEPTAGTVADLEERYLGTAESLREWAERWIEDTDMLGSMPEDLRRYFDADAYVHDAEVSGDIYAVEHDGKVSVFAQY